MSELIELSKMAYWLGLKIGFAVGLWAGAVFYAIYRNGKRGSQ